MKVLNFRSETEEIGIIQPNKTIRGYNPYIYSSGKTNFRIEVGCQKLTITSNNIDQILDELTGKEKAEELIKVIVPTNSTKQIKSIKNVARFLEESANYYVSTNKKIYPKDGFVILEKTFKCPNDYFTINSYGTTLYSEYSLTKAEASYLVSIFTVLKNHFDSLKVVEPEN